MFQFTFSHYTEFILLAIGLLGLFLPFRVVQRWVPDPETGEKDRRAWQMRTERVSYKNIERELSKFPTTAHPGSSYAGMFKNPIYIGRLHYRGGIYGNFVPALATMDQWERVRALDHSRPARGEKYPA